MRIVEPVERAGDLLLGDRLDGAVLAQAGAEKAPSALQGRDAPGLRRSVARHAKVEKLAQRERRTDAGMAARRAEMGENQLGQGGSLGVIEDRHRMEGVQKRGAARVFREQGIDFDDGFAEGWYSFH